MLAALERIAKRAYSSLETVQASYDIACAAIRNGIPGDFVECGVGAGANAAAMALAIMDPAHYWNENKRNAETLKQAWPPRRVHLFDSFTGIPQAGAEDVEFLAAGHKAGLTAHSRKEVERAFTEWGLPLELFVFHEGMFARQVPFATGSHFLTGEEAAHKIAHIEKIAVLRLDGDLYESTKVCIERLYPLVSKGGWIIVDDWDLSGARKAVLDYMGHGFGPVYWSKTNV